VLIPLDDSQNAILSFGQIDTDTSWYEDRGMSSISAGFVKSLDRRTQVGNSTPMVTTRLATNPNRGISNYAIDWDLDPATLSNVIDRKNTAIQPTAKLPRILKVAILYDVRVLPFQRNNFALPYANLWNHEKGTYKYVATGEALRNAMLTIEVNGFRETKYRYVLKRVYELTLIDDSDDDIDAGCTLLEFEAA
jgi:hypothetical protein